MEFLSPGLSKVMPIEISTGSSQIKCFGSKIKYDPLKLICLV